MKTMVRLGFAAVLAAGLLGCEYVRPTLNEPLAKWDPQYGYRFSNLAPPEEGNSDSLFLVASFSGGGTRANWPTSQLSGKAKKDGCLTSWT